METIDNLRIGYDAKRAVCNNTGLGNYSRYVIDTMSARYPQHQYLLYTPADKPNPRLQPLLERSNIELVSPTGLMRMFPSFWRSIDMTTRFGDDGISIYHGLSNELPLNIRRSSVAAVVTIHDVIWRKWPQDYSAIDRAIYDMKYGHSARNADRIIAISECTKRDIIEAFGVEPEKIDVIYQGCDPIFYEKLDPDKKIEISRLYNLPPRFVIAVGSLQSRKNQMLALKALEYLPQDVCLVLVGHGKSYKQLLTDYANSHGMAQRVIWLDNKVPFDHLPYLYSLSQFSSYTSRYEGFGIPIIESLAAGAPVIASNSSCLTETGGRGALYVDADDVRAYVEAAQKLLESKYHRDKLVDQGHRHIKRFDQRDFAQKIMATYNKAIYDKLMAK